MTRHARTTASKAPRPMFQMIAGSLLAGAVLTGCAASAGERPETAAAKASEALAKGKVEKAIPQAEAAVLGAPHEAGYRAMLANAYMKAGRFSSAAQAFDEARQLGDETPRTALSLALSQIASGQSRDALAVLHDAREAIPAGDLGLAMALAGDPRSGINILVEEIRRGNNTPKVRQNLAFAYALGGMWREARVMMAQDVAPAQVGDRIAEWATMAQPEAYQQRVASLLGVPVRADEGFPAELALANFPQQQAQIADIAAPAQAIAALDVAPPAPPLPVEADMELPPVAVASAAPAPVLPALLPAAMPGELVDGAREIALPPSAATAAVESDVKLETAPVQLAYADPVAELPALERARDFGAMLDGAPEVALPVSAMAAAPVKLDVSPDALEDSPAAITFVSQPMVQSIPVNTASTGVGQRRSPAYRVRGENAVAAAAAAPVAAASSNVAPGTHMVQIGAYSSRDAARSAWSQAVARHPSLGSYRMATSTVTVNGKVLYRVAAAGFDGNRAASAMCGTIRSRGASCMVLAAPRDGVTGDTRMAARR